jgi:hypothetical protein
MLSHKPKPPPPAPSHSCYSCYSWSKKAHVAPQGLRPYWTPENDKKVSGLIYSPGCRTNAFTQTETIHIPPNRNRVHSWYKTSTRVAPSGLWPRSGTGPWAHAPRRQHAATFGVESPAIDGGAASKQGLFAEIRSGKSRKKNAKKAHPVPYQILHRENRKWAVLALVC